MAWLTKLQEAVKNQTGKVFQQMSPAEQEQAQERAEKWKKEQATAQHQAPENQASEIQPADHPAVQASGAAEQPRDKKPVSLLVQRHGMLIERQARVAQMLEEARAQLPATQDQQSTRAPAHAPGTVQPLTLPTSPGVSARSSPSTPSGQPMSPTRPESAASDTVSAHLPQAPLQESPARLQRQGSESGQDTRELDRSRQPRNASDGQITEVSTGGGPSLPAHLGTQDAAEEGKGPPLARYQTPEKLADRQVRPSDIDTPDAPAHPEKTPAPPTSPATPSSPSSLVAPRAHAGSSAAAGAATTDQPLDAQQESRARLQRQAGELRRTIQGLAGPLEAVREEARQVGRQLGAVETQIKLNDDAITEVLRKKGFHAQAPLDKEDSRLHLEKAELEQRARQLARSEDTLTALLAPPDETSRK